ncbi:AI-2E family transporter YdiK [Orbaceae bacterium ac157xtp]
MPIEKNNDLFKLILNLLIIGLFIIVCYRIIEPFLFGFFWAVMVVITTWPLMIKIQKKVYNRRSLSVIILLALLSLFIIIPVILIVFSITKNASYLIDLTKNLSHQPLPKLAWLQNIPLVGQELHQKYADLINNDGAELIKTIQPYFGTVVSVVIDQATNIGILIFHFAIMLAFSIMLYFKGESVLKYVYLIANKLSKHYGVNAVTLAGKSIRAVALGVVVTAITLALLGGLSLIITNVPFPGLITLLLFVCCVAQIGPVIIMLPCIAWLFWQDHIFSAIFLIIVTLLLTTLDSVMRTYLIKKGADLPFLLILFGVIGGLLGFGVMGLFIGPVMLAVAYNFVHAWIVEQD